MNLFIRADTGAAIGTGYIMRALALAQAWKRSGGDVTFACGQLPRSLIKQIESENFNFHQVKNDNCDIGDAQEAFEIASNPQADWIVLAGARFDEAYQATLSNSQAKLLVVDDFGDASHRHADLVLNQNLNVDTNQHAKSDHNKVLSGHKYVLLGNEFENSEPKRIVAEARRILVTFGSLDPDNWTLKSLQVLSDLNRKRLVVDCVVGACYPHLAELEIFKKTANMSLRIHRNVDRMSSLLSRTDLAITAADITCYELARSGVPSIVRAINQNQAVVSQTMSDLGVVISIDKEINHDTSLRIQPGSDDSRLRSAIRSLINDADRRQTMSDRGRHLVDGMGADRIARRMMAGRFSFRSATIQDASSMWHWQNDPEVRSVAFNDQPISLGMFRDEFRKRLADPRIETWIAETHNSQTIGLVKFDLSDPQLPPQISVIVDQTVRGRGLGTVLISQACEDFFNRSERHEIVARIKPGNVASEKAFRAAGFVGITPVIIGGKMALQFLLDRDAISGSQLPATSQKSA